MNSQKHNENFIPKMSYSSACMLHKCERKYWLAKVAKRAPDSDAQLDNEAFQYGKAYHEVLELTQHRRPKDLKPVVLAAAKNHNLEREQTFRIYAMCEKYYSAREFTGLVELASELRFQDDDFIGYIDGVLEDPQTKFWWILDLKTSTRIDALLAARIHRDIQLNFYASFAKDIAVAIDRPLQHFAGVRYSICARPTARPKKTETMKEYSSRVDVKYQEYYVAAEHLDPLTAESFVAAARFNQERLFEVKDIEYTVPNYLACNDFFRPCEFWSACYGHTVTSKERIPKSIFPDTETATDDNPNDTPEF